jgi:hypothetical protein
VIPSSNSRDHPRSGHGYSSNVGVEDLPGEHHPTARGKVRLISKLFPDVIRRGLADRDVPATIRAPDVDPSGAEREKCGFIPVAGIA